MLPFLSDTHKGPGADLEPYRVREAVPTVVDIFWQWAATDQVRQCTAESLDLFLRIDPSQCEARTIMLPPGKPYTGNINPDELHMST